MPKIIYFFPINIALVIARQSKKKSFLLFSPTRALQESLLYSSTSKGSPDEDDDRSPLSEDIDGNLELAMRLSRAEKLKENELMMEENRMLELAIKLSLEES